LSARIRELDALLVRAGATVRQNFQSPTSGQSSAAAEVDTQLFILHQPGSAGAADSDPFCCSALSQDLVIGAERPDFGLFSVNSDTPAFSEIVWQVAMSVPAFKVIEVCVEPTVAGCIQNKSREGRSQK